MHDITINFGDLLTKRNWGKLGNAGLGMAFKLLARYIATQQPLPAELDDIAFQCDAHSDEERRTLGMVLKYAFELDASAPTGPVYRLPWVDVEILKFIDRCDSAMVSNIKGAAKKTPHLWPENIGQLTVDSFRAHRACYIDPITQRLRFQHNGAVSVLNGAETATLAAETAPNRTPKPPFSGNHLPTLPPSHLPTLPDTPKAPKGAESLSSSTVNPESADTIQEMPNTLASPPSSVSTKKRKEAAEAIYEAYPKKVGKDKALPSIAKRLAAGMNADELLGKVQQYAQAVATWPPDDRQFVPNPATWFNQGRFGDDPQTWLRGSINRLPSELGAKKEGAGVASTAPAAPEGWQQGWVGSYGDIPCPEAWQLLSAAQKADVRGWLATHANAINATEGTDPQ
jgi:hypothetical protein